MRQRRHIVLAVTGVLVVTFLVYTALSSSSRSTAPAVSLKPQDKKSTPVQTITVQHGTISQRITATGDILADARVEVFPKVEGHLRELRVEEGDRVRAGQVTAQIADDDLRAAVARA